MINNTFATVDFMKYLCFVDDDNNSNGSARLGLKWCISLRSLHDIQ